MSVVMVADSPGRASRLGEVLAEGGIDVWLTADTHQVLDLCKRGKAC